MLSTTHKSYTFLIFVSYNIENYFAEIKTFKKNVMNSNYHKN